MQSPGASGARQTRRARVPRVALSKAPDTRRGAESPGHLTAHQCAGGLESWETTRRGALGCFFNGGGVGRWRARSTLSSAYAYIAKVRCRYQPDFPFGLLKALCDGPTASDHLDCGRQGGRRRGTYEVRGALGRVAETATDQQPPTPVEQGRCRSREPSPIIPSGAFGPVTRLHAAPVLLLPHRQERFDLPRAIGTPDIFFP